MDKQLKKKQQARKGALCITGVAERQNLGISVKLWWIPAKPHSQATFASTTSGVQVPLALSLPAKLSKGAELRDISALEM